MNKTSERPPVALEQAFEVLRFLPRPGNPAASEIFRDITQSTGLPGAQSCNYDEIAFSEHWEYSAASDAAFDLKGDLDFAFNLSGEVKGVDLL
ncbi:hypothetical protein N7495_004188 [Penicillium taxi]|uniref:uncharacterized protein n=1 Tax=Penicillium taxi TaxID=168475 RepID=UPI0025450C1F|nr:uncharacterized protein N7495_004188 [Penicillium taxi]KAJ5899444.1 hypothetical protein N7495_004188 [Penicillium taxi]